MGGGCGSRDICWCGILCEKEAAGDRGERNGLYGWDNIQKKKMKKMKKKACKTDSFHI